MDHIYERINLNYYIKQGLQFFPRSNTFLSWTTCIGSSNNDWSMTSLPHFWLVVFFFQETYKTKVPYDPEGALGTLTSAFLVFLGVQVCQGCH